MSPLANEVGGYTYNISAASAINATIAVPKQTGPFHGVDLQPSEMCPKNFIIFDQTDNKSRIMFHPALANKFNYPSFDIHGTCEENGVVNVNINESSSLKEDTEDIDALLSLEDEGSEDEEVSTGRTMGNYGGSSPNSYSTGSSRARRKMRSSTVQKTFPCSSGSSSSNNERKRQRMNKTLAAMRGIVPGGDGMDTATVLDEAVRYLKSLKVEVKKLGIGNFKKI